MFTDTYRLVRLGSQEAHRQAELERSRRGVELDEPYVRATSIRTSTPVGPALPGPMITSSSPAAGCGGCEAAEAA
jgi:hypothetical protein